jgi:RpiR family carbohydrate utilization transcriptional regulator
VQYAAAHSLREGDVLLAIANTGSSAPVVDCAKAAAERGAAVIALTSFRRSPLTASADVSLVTGVSEQQWRTLRSSFTAMIDVLRTAVALRLGATSDELAQATAAAVPGTVVYRQSDDDQRP